MSTVTLSPKYQVVIPQVVREALALRPGTKFQVMPYDGRIELVPVWPMTQARGFLRLKDTVITREEEDRL